MMNSWSCEVASMGMIFAKNKSGLVWFGFGDRHNWEK
jgi:hypothetical protein